MNTTNSKMDGGHFMRASPKMSEKGVGQQRQLSICGRNM